MIRDSKKYLELLLGSFVNWWDAGCPRSWCPKGRMVFKACVASFAPAGLGSLGGVALFRLGRAGGEEGHSFPGRLLFRHPVYEVLEKTLESPLDWKEIKPVNPKGNQP